MQTTTPSSTTGATTTTRSLRDHVRVARTYWAGALAIVALGVAAGAGWTMTQPRVYSSTASGVVQVATSGDANGAFAADQLAKSQAESYVELGGSSAVAEDVVEATGSASSPASLLGRVTADLPEDTALISVTATGSTPTDAAALADAWIAGMQKRITEMQEDAGGLGKPLTSFVPLSSAVVPTAPSSPDVARSLVLGGLSGLLLAAAYVLVRDALDRRIRSAAAVEQRFGLGVLGTIPLHERLAGTGGLVGTLPVESADDRHANFALSEALRELRTNLSYVKVDERPRVIVMTSPQPGDGKSTLSANLAQSLALSTSDRVVVVDCDLRRPTLAKTFGMSEGAGLTDVLSGRAELHDVMQQSEDAANLWVVGAGRIPPNPSELLGSKTFRELVRTLSLHATVVLDAPPVLAVTDAAVLASGADGVLMTATAGKTTFDQLDRAVTGVRRGGGEILGVVLNRVPTKGRDAREYGYYGGSYYYYEGDATTTGAETSAPAPTSPPTAPVPPVDARPTPPAGDAAPSAPSDDVTVPSRRALRARERER